MTSRRKNTERPRAAAPKKGALKKKAVKKSVGKRPAGKTVSRKQQDGNGAAAEHSALIPVVAIGASAGGLEAITELLEHLPPNLGMAYVIIQHLSPHHESILPDLLEQKTAMPVRKVTDKMHISADTVYVIPPDAFMSIQDSKLTLQPRFKTDGANHSVDFFMTALAPIYQGKAIGIVLSGSATDGTYGVQMIKTEGGITFAQDETARFQSMPSSAVQSGFVDFVLSPKRIAEELRQIVKNSYSLIASKEVSLNESSMRKVQQMLLDRKGIDFNHYKRSTIQRRIARRIALNKLKSLEEYNLYLRQNKEELDMLYKDLLINVTSFFRDPSVFDKLTKYVFPALLKNRKANDPIRIWIPACATGEEAFSIAITLFEFLKTKAISTPIQIFATDLNDFVIEKARIGIYPASALHHVSPQRLKHFFVKIDGYYQIIKPIRDICIFATHDLLSDPPFSRIDLISCQNVMIYLERSPQKRILGAFHYSLNDTGYLLLGKSEAIGDSGDLFEPVFKDMKFYSKKSAAGHPEFSFAVRSPMTLPKMARESKEATVRSAGEIDIEKQADKLLLNKYVPSSILINGDLQILRFQGTTSAYVRPVAGKASLNLLKMVRDELVIPLRALIGKVKKERQTAKKDNIVLHTNGSSQELSLEVSPIPSVSKQNYYLILFHEGTALEGVAPIFAGKVENGNGAASRRLQAMGLELKEAREQLKAMGEEFEAMKQDLQSANEEVLSSNEELQSINEELETSKEELQSSNEELTTINEELHRRNSELKDAVSYTESIVETIREPLLVLSMDLRVRKANKAFYSSFGARPDNTLNQLLYQLNNGIWRMPLLQEQLAEIVHKGNPFRDFELASSGSEPDEKTFLFNAMRMSQQNRKEDLLLLVIEDITQRRRDEEQIKQNAEVFRLLVQNAFDIITIFSGDGTIRYESESIERGLGYKPEERIGRNIFTDPIVHPDDLVIKQRAFHEAIRNKTGSRAEFRLRHKDGSYRVIDAAFINLLDDGRISGVVGNYHDITDKKRLERQKEEFIGIASHELKTPVTSIKGYLQILHRDLEERKDSEVVDILGKTLKQVNRLDQLIADLLDVTRIREGQLKLRETLLDMNELVREVVQDFGQIYKQHEFITELKATNLVHADRIRIAQVLSNLLTNAIKYSPGEHKILVRTSSDIEDLTVSVSDQGVGIDQAHHEKVFERFFRVNDVSASISSGIGLGLFLCREIISRHGGNIWLKSQKNKGSTFYFTLPMKP